MDSAELEIASLTGEELLSVILVTFQGDLIDYPEQLVLNKLISIHMDSEMSGLPNAVLRQLEDFEATADQLLPIRTTIRVAGTLIDFSDEATLHFFLTRNVVSTVVVLLDDLLGLRLELAPSRENRLETCATCLMFLLVTMHCSNGVPWVVEAFESGLLTILLKVTDELNGHTRRLGDLARGGLETLIGEIIRTMTEYMCYYSVITALSGIRGRHNAARIARAQESGPLKDKWVAFFNLITERCAVQGLFSARIRNVPIRCDNVECTVGARRRDMLKCAGCLCTFYCSPPCQRRAWRHGDHKSRCKCNGLDTKEGLFTWGSRDAAFLPVLCETSIMKNMTFISVQVREKFPSLPAHEISFSIDFRLQTPEVKVLHVEEVARLVPDLEVSNTIQAAASARQFICLSTLASSEDRHDPSQLGPGIQRVSLVKCEVLYNLLETQRQPTPRKRKEYLDTAKKCCQSFENLINEVRSDFRLFLEDSSRRKWSSSTAKDIACKSFETAGMNCLFTYANQQAT